MKESPPSSEVTLVAAVSVDGFISRGSGVPWDLPADRQHFRSLTSGQWLLVGRRTHAEMLGWFQDHQVLVLSRDTDFHPAPGRRVASSAEAVRLAREAKTPLFVIGGGRTYADALPHATKLVLTVVDQPIESGIPFPSIDPERWKQIDHRNHPSDEQHAHGFSIQTWALI